MPAQFEIDLMPVGTSIETPLGTLVKHPDGRATVTLNQQGQVAYRQAYAKAHVDFGDFPGKQDPAVPQPDIKVGGYNYNPLGNRWGRG